VEGTDWSYNRAQNQQEPIQPMKKPQSRWIIGIVLTIGLIVFVAACATQTSEVAKSDVQAALVQAGFKAKPAMTAEQQQHLQSLPEHQFVVVREKGKKFYLWADKPNKRLYCGNQQAYRAYKGNRTAQQAQAHGAFTYIADPDGFTIPVTVYHDWAPFGQW
jgi:hypothetical protein